MEELVVFVVSFVVVYLFYLFFVILNEKKLYKFRENIYFNFLVKNYHLDLGKVTLSFLANVVSLANSFIIATTCTIVCFVDNFILKMLLAFAVLVSLQLFVYFTIGKLLNKKYGRK